MVKLYIASDHAGVELKSKLLLDLASSNYVSKFEVHDLGPYSKDSVDYPDYADLVCRKIHGLKIIGDQTPAQAFPHEVGILICGSGQGMSIRANKFPHIRAALCWNKEIAQMAREHNDANVLCLGARAIDSALALEIMETFLSTNFAGGRHQTRVVKVLRPV